MKKLIYVLITSALANTMLNGQNLRTEKNVAVEWEYSSKKQHENPFRDIDLVSEIRLPDGSIRIIPAFWAGGSTWKFRYSSSVEGEHTFSTICSDISDKNLHNQKGQIVVHPYSGNNPLYQHGAVTISNNKRYLVHLDGIPFFWLADSWWHGMTSRFSWPNDFHELAQNRKDKGFSVIQFAVGFPCDIEPFDHRGQNEAGDPWDSEWKSIRPEYFDLTDKRISHLIDLGLMPNIVGAWGYYIKWAGVENMKKHWEYLIARYGAYPVTWTLAGESTLAWYHDLATRWDEQKEIFREQWSEVAAHIKKKDPYNRVLTVHPGPNSGDLKPINEMEYIDMVMCQSGHDGYFALERSVKSIQSAMELYPDKPVIHGEVCFEGMDGKSWQDVQRFLFWSNILLGTPGFSYGVEGIWQFNTEEQLFGESPNGNVWGNVPWETAQHYKGSQQLGFGAGFIKEYDWWKLVPATSRIESRSEEVLTKPFCAILDDEYLFVYMFQKPTRWRPYQVNGLIPEKTYQVTWFNPITGEKCMDKFTCNSIGKLDIDRVPIMQDWVLVIHLE